VAMTEKAIVLHWQPMLDRRHSAPTTTIVNLGNSHRLLQRAPMRNQPRRRRRTYQWRQRRGISVRPPHQHSQHSQRSVLASRKATRSSPGLRHRTATSTSAPPRRHRPRCTCSTNIMRRTEHPINEKVGKSQSPMLTHSFMSHDLERAHADHVALRVRVRPPIADWQHFAERQQNEKPGMGNTRWTNVVVVIGGAGSGGGVVPCGWWQLAPPHSETATACAKIDYRTRGPSKACVVDSPPSPARTG
jgi:hypothetical protein